MSRNDEVRGMIATMLMMSPSEVREETSLAPFTTSLGSTKLRLGLKRLGLALPSGVLPRTYAGLIEALDGTTEPAAPGQPRAPQAASLSHGAAVASGQIQVGLDVEEIGALPAAADYWEHEFYRGSFAKSEIAYAVQQPEPRTHFAGFWCAKEALRKCDPAFAQVEFPRIAVAHDAGGKPYLTLAGNGGCERLPHVVSITHATDVAASIVATGSGAPAELIEITAPVIAAEAQPSRRRSRGLARLFGI